MESGATGGFAGGCVWRIWAGRDRALEREPGDGGWEQVEPTAVCFRPARLASGFVSLNVFCVVFHQSGKQGSGLCGPDSGPIKPTAEQVIGLSVLFCARRLAHCRSDPGKPAAEAHLAAGALITQIEHRPAASWTRDQMEQWINSHARGPRWSLRTGRCARFDPRVWDLVP